MDKKVAVILYSAWFDAAGIRHNVVPNLLDQAQCDLHLFMWNHNFSRTSEVQQFDPVHYELLPSHEFVALDFLQCQQEIFWDAFILQHAAESLSGRLNSYDLVCAANLNVRLQQPYDFASLDPGRIWTCETHAPYASPRLLTTGPQLFVDVFSQWYDYLDNYGAMVGDFASRYFAEYLAEKQLLNLVDRPTSSVFVEGTG